MLRKTHSTLLSGVNPHSIKSKLFSNAQKSIKTTSKLHTPLPPFSHHIAQPRLLPTHHATPSYTSIPTISNRHIAFRGRQPTSKRFTFADHKINLNDMHGVQHGAHRLTAEEEYEQNVQQLLSKQTSILNHQSLSSHLKTIGTLFITAGLFITNSLYFNWKEETEYVSSPDKLFEYIQNNGLGKIFTEAYPVDRLQDIFECSLTTNLHANSKEYASVQKLMNKHLSLGLYLLTLSKTSREMLTRLKCILQDQQTHPNDNIYKKTYFSHLSSFDPHVSSNASTFPPIEPALNIHSKDIPTILEELEAYEKIIDTTIDTITDEMADIFANYTRPTEFISVSLPLDELIQNIALSYSSLNSLKLILKHINLWILYSQTRQFYYPHAIPHFSQLLDMWDALYPVEQPRFGRLDIDYEAEVKKLQAELQQKDPTLSPEDALTQAFSNLSSSDSNVLDNEAVMRGIVELREKMKKIDADGVGDGIENAAADGQGDERNEGQVQKGQFVLTKAQEREEVERLALEEFKFLIQHTTDSMSASAGRLIEQQKNPHLFGIPAYIHPPQIIQFFQKLVANNAFFRFQSMNVYSCEVDDNSILVPPKPNEIINLTLFPFVGADHYRIDITTPRSSQNRASYPTSNESPLNSTTNALSFQFHNNFPIKLPSLPNTTPSSPPTTTTPVPPPQTSSNSRPATDDLSSPSITPPWTPTAPIFLSEDDPHQLLLKEAIKTGLPVNANVAKVKGFDINPYLQTAFYFVTTPLPRVSLPTTATHIFDDIELFNTTFKPTATQQSKSFISSLIPKEISTLTDLLFDRDADDVAEDGNGDVRKKEMGKGGNKESSHPTGSLAAEQQQLSQPHQSDQTLPAAPALSSMQQTGTKPPRVRRELFPQAPISTSTATLPSNDINFNTLKKNKEYKGSDDDNVRH